MKTINSSGAQWDNKLLEDLGFIKKKLRYPLNTKTLAPVVIVGFITTLIAFILLASYMQNKGQEHKINYNILFFFIVSFIPFTVSIVRYIQSLRFVSISTPYTCTENMALIEKFLKAQQLVVFRHPEAPEVFQIISKSIDQYKDQREVMIFIADDNRILVNSHFTNQGFVMVAVAPHRKEMSIALQQWISGNSQPSKDISTI